MARIDTNGLDALMLSMEELSDIPDGVIDDMLSAGGEVIAKAHAEELQSMGLVKTGKLKSSIKVFHKRSKGVRYVLVYPDGTHHTYDGRSHSYTKMNWGRAGNTQSTSGGSKTATNNEVGFIHEFGAPRRNIPASQWMRVSNEKHADEAVDAAKRVYDDYLTSKGL